MKKVEETAIFAAGCFWGVESAFRNIKGVIDTEVGYSGGTTQNPSYEQVCSGRTGHAESVKIVFDPQIISYEKLLKIFWNIHNPTQINRQGPDIGSQYRSVIFFRNESQKKKALSSKKQLEERGKFDKPIATSIEKSKKFFAAEEYHQDYLQKRDRNSCFIA